MIIQCEQCSTKFKLDDAKVTAKGVKVRCAKCKHVFTVTKEPSDMEQQPDFGAMLDQSAALDQDDATEFSAPRQEVAGDDTEPSFDMSFASPDTNPDQTGLMDDSLSLGTFQEKTESPLSEHDDFSFTFQENNTEFVTGQGETAAPEGSTEFPGFVPGGTAADAVETVSGAPSFSASESAAFEFGDEDPFGDTTSTSIPGKDAEPSPFDFNMSGLAGSMGTEKKVPDGNLTVAGDEEAKTEEPFSIGEITFDDESSPGDERQVTTGEPAAIREPVTAAAKEELPPLSIASRRKQSPLFTGFVAVLATAIILLLGYYGYSMLFADKVVKEIGRITLRGVNASFVKNGIAGEILVISGEAVNEFAKPRAAIQVKGMMYGTNGQVIVSKNAYAGNLLTKEQLASMPLDKIEATMANQFGDSLANLEVAPGKAIPFIIVIANPPAEAKDYGVELAGSTVATGKQQ
jgi:predicted Zn finger-like uncharacterized protein